MNAVMELFKRHSAENFCPGPALPIGQCRYVVMDTELTGLDVKKDSIVSIGAIAMAGGKIILGETFYEMVSPETALRPESIVVHGIMPSEVVGKPSISAVLDDLLKFCEGAIVVGHFFSLDLGFLNKELKRLQGRKFRHPVVDTLQLHEWMQDNSRGSRSQYDACEENKDLFSLAKKYHVQVSASHNALMDAFITAQLFQRFLSALPGLGVRTVKDLLQIAKP